MIGSKNTRDILRGITRIRAPIYAPPSDEDYLVSSVGLAALVVGTPLTLRNTYNGIPWNCTIAFVVSNQEAGQRTSFTVVGRNQFGERVSETMSRINDSDNLQMRQSQHCYSYVESITPTLLDVPALTNITFGFKTDGTNPHILRTGLPFKLKTLGDIAFIENLAAGAATNPAQWDNISASTVVVASSSVLLQSYTSNVAQVLSVGLHPNAFGRY